MLWAKAAIVGGLLLLGVTFAVSVGDLPVAQPAHPARAQGDGCADVIPSSWLVPGTADSAARPPRTVAERRAAARCAVVLRRERLVIGGVMGLGALAVLAGWTALREREDTEPRLSRPVPV